SMYKLRTAGGKFTAMLLVLYNVRLKERAAIIPNITPKVLSSAPKFHICVAKTVPNNTNNTANNLIEAGTLRVCMVSINTPIHTDCMRKTTATDAFKYLTQR